MKWAAKLGAAAAIIVHETKPAAYPYEVVVNSLDTRKLHPENRWSERELPRGSRVDTSGPRQGFVSCRWTGFREGQKVGLIAGIQTGQPRGDGDIPGAEHVARDRIEQRRGKKSKVPIRS